MDRLHHVAITVPSISDAVSWYCRKFECEMIYQDETWALIQFENIALALVSPDQHPPHFAIERDDAGLYGLVNKHRDGTASVYISDPWGNTVEILKTQCDPFDNA